MIKILAMLCSMAAPDHCHEVAIIVPGQQMTMADCMNPAKIVDWAEKNHPTETLQGWKCLTGPKGQDI